VLPLPLFDQALKRQFVWVLVSWSKRDWLNQRHKGTVPVGCGR
jgi:hypothetical protein